MGTIGIRHEVARRIETLLRDVKPNVRAHWLESTLKASGRLRFSSPLPAAVYARLLDEFVEVLCSSLERDDLQPVERFWPDHARAGHLSGHTHDEVAHLCSTVCRSVSEAVDRVVEGSEDGPSVRIATQRILSRIQDGLERAPEPQTEQPPAGRTDLDALVSAAEHLREGLAWSELYDRDIRRSRRLEALRLMLVETRSLAPAQAAESVLHRLHDELPCRACLLVRQAASGAALRLECAWPREPLSRELGEEMHLADGALERFPPNAQAATCAVDHDRGELDAELLGFGARAMLAAPLPRTKDAAAWLILGLRDERALAPDDVEFVATAGAVLGAALDNARAAKTHRDAKALHRAIFDAATDLVFLLDREGRCLDVSRSALARFGLEPEQVLGRTPPELFGADAAAHVERLINQVFESGAATTFSTTLPGRDGPTFETTLSPVRSAGGDVTAVLGIARDVTMVRRLMERPVEPVVDEQPVAIDRLMRGAPVGIALLDEHGRVIAVNDALAALLRPGDMADALVGADLVSAEDAPLHAVARQLDEAAHGATVISRPFPFSRQGGVGEMWLAVRARSMSGEGEQGARVLLVVEDVTEHVRLQSDLLKAEHAAAVGDLVAELAEDLNNRLGPVIGHAQMLQHRKIGIAEMAHVNAIERCAQSLRRIIESLLAFAKPPASAPRLCNVNDAVREACALVDDDCKAANAPHARHVKLALDLDMQLPPTLADGRQLVQVFLNLLDNARQAMAERGGTITVTSSSDGATIVVTIADTGEGIEPDELERIFEPSSTMRATRFGAGLGLTVARAVVRNHGGSIAVESKRHRGTTVRVALPVRTPSGVQPDDAKPRQAAPPRALRILLAEPDGEMLGMIKKLLVGAGNRVVDCGTPDAVLKALHEETFDVVVADVAMPGVSGFDLHVRLLAQWPELASRVVFTTARTCDARTSAFVHSTGGRLVTKPFDVRDLLAAVAAVAPPPRR